MTVLAWVLSIVAAGSFLSAGGLKLVTPKQKLHDSMQMGWTDDFTDNQVKLIGGAEVLGGVGLILPWLLGVAAVLTPIAGVCLAALMGGAVRTHLRRGEQSGAAPAAVLGVLALVVAIIRFTQL